MTNWLIKFNGTSDTMIIAAPTCNEAIQQAEESSDYMVRSVSFHSTSMCVTTEKQQHESLAV